MTTRTRQAAERLSAAVVVFLAVGSGAVDVLAGGDDYLPRAVFYSSGVVTRFERAPVRVRVGPLPDGLEDSGYGDDLLRALALWEQAAGDVVRWRIVDEAEKEADVEIAWTTAAERQSRREHHLGKASLVRLSAEEFHVRVTLGVYDLTSGSRLTHDNMRTVCLHEFGHALGLWGHSDVAADVMAPASEATAPTERDAATLRRLYALPPNTPLFAQALPALHADIAADPENVDLHFLLGSMLHAAKEYDAAIAEFLWVLERDALHREAGEALVRAYLDAGRPDEALARARAEPMLDAAAVNDAAKALYERGETQRAIRALEEAAAGSPANTVLRRNLAEMYIGDAGRLFQVGEYDRAEPLLRRALELFPGDFRYLLRLAGTLNRLAREDEAIVAFRQVLEADADNAEARRGLATALNNRGVGKTAQGRWEEAYRDFDAALEAMPGLAGARENRAAALWNWAESSESTDHNQALDLYRKHAELEPDSAETYTRIGALLAAKRQDYAGALAAFLRAFEQRPGAPHTRRNLLIARHQYGVSLDQQGRYDDAIRQYEAALTLDPDYLDLYRSLGQTYRRSGRREQAAAAYLEILRREPTDAWAQEAIVALYVDAGNEAVRKGDIAAALAEFEQVPETARTAAIYGMLGYLYLAAKRPVDAMDALGRSLLLDPKDRTTRANFDLAAKAVRAEAERNPTPERTAARRRTDAYELAADVARRPRPQALARFASLLDRPPDDEATVRALQDCALAVVREAAPRYAEQAAAIGQKALALDAAHAGLKAWAAGLPPPTPAKP